MPSSSGRDHHDPHAGHHGGRRIRAVRTRRDQADVAPLVAARAVVGPDGQQTGQLALAPGVGLDRDLGVAGQVGQPPLEVVDQGQVARRAVQRGERVDVGEPRQADRLHLGGGVELHGARPQRDHAAVEREVLVRQLAQVAQHGRLGVVLARTRGGRGSGPGAASASGSAAPELAPPRASRTEGARGPPRGAPPWSSRRTRCRRGRRRRGGAARRGPRPSRRSPRPVRAPARPPCRRTPRCSRSNPARRSPVASPTVCAVDPAGDRRAGRPARGTRRTWRPPRPAAPGPCRCWRWPSRGGCAAHASAAPAGRPDGPRRRPTARRDGRAGRARARP